MSEHSMAGAGVVPVGIAVGDGTGPELTPVFLRALRTLAGGHFEPIQCPHRFRTFSAATAAGVTPHAARAMEDEDAAAYEAFLRELAARGAPVVWRTAFNAASLYRVRERLCCVKVEHLPVPGGEVLLVRDQAQGFYAGTNDDAAAPDRIARLCVFRRDVTHAVLEQALAFARDAWGEAAARAARFVVVCKFHLLDNRFATWVADWADAHGRRVEVYQPDTANRHLLAGTFRGRVVLVGANEWADIMHADLMARHGAGLHDECFSRNVYLDHEVRGITEYQTVHGSADDIAGTDRVNPVATLRAAAHVAEHVLGVGGAVGRMDEAIRATGADEGRCSRRAAAVLGQLAGEAQARARS